ncbi:MBL fold metallo-hydrolase [Haladaptatus sp. R4]|uniref:MBL fold metallo-hydrolase n=1 Tax=Haladaptatus sp. R4 TaxID=1679489 RepID=UPI0007B4DBC8|nr:MBL fold metallo-hydrolase [Haladaptatus sp. R4]KZN23489.1 MBL fold metallo-hydrolase [Haladaptatus sp. R4]
MASSDWGDWLPREVEETTPDGIALWYLGCNGFILKGSDETTLFIDPYVGTGDPPRTVRMIPVPFDPEDVTEADAVLATHEHTDHVHGPSQAPILASTGATFYAPDDSLAVARQDEQWTDNWDVSDDQFEEVAEGETFEVGEFTIHVEPSHDADATHPVSYVIEHGDVTFFHGGDTKPGEKLETVGESYDIDLGVLAFGSDGWIPDKETREPKYTKWYSDENEIADAANALQLDTLLPTHWDMWKGLTADPTALYDHTRSYDYPNALKIIEIGDRVELS